VAHEEALDQLREACKQLNISLEDALREKVQEVLCRSFLLCIPNHTLRTEQIPEYLKEIGRKPTDELIEQVTLARRGPPLSEEEIIALEQRQNLRCALCGTRLDRAARPHVDHIVPVALGGKSDVSNLQLLCHPCNIGKGSLLSWIVGVPFQTKRVTYRLRYCVLARAGGMCQQPGCKQSSLSTELLVIARIPEQRGGPLLLDNLYVLCRKHYDAKMAGNRRQAINSLKLKRVGQLFGIRAL
jgi:5-methylcytosine-specific restriction endonuclease McrA